MSHEIVKSISVTKDKVFLTSADSSLRPLHFHRWECTSLSKVLNEQGREAVLALLGEDIWNGNLRLYQGNKLCKLFLEARSELPRKLHFSNYDSKTAGMYLGKMVAKLEKEPYADLSSIVDEALTIRNDREYILNAAKRSGHNFLDYASEEVQKDRAFALEVLRAGAGAAWFRYPKQYQNDKAFALEALRLNGCVYRELSDELKADREIILAAFEEREDRKSHEHLPDLIPLEAYCQYDAAAHKLNIDTSFICDLLDRCPSMHLNRDPALLMNREIVLKWVQVGRFFPSSVTDLPQDYLMDEAVQNALCKRFEGTDKYEVLLKRFHDAGVVLARDSLDARIKSISARAAEQSLDNTADPTKDIPER